MAVATLSNALIAALQKIIKVTLTTNSDNSMKEAVYGNDVDGALWIPSDVDSRINNGESAVKMEVGNSLNGNILRGTLIPIFAMRLYWKLKGNFSVENMNKILSEQASVSVISKDAALKDDDYYANLVKSTLRIHHSFISRYLSSCLD